MAGKYLEHLGTWLIYVDIDCLVDGCLFHLSTPGILPRDIVPILSLFNGVNGLMWLR